MPRKGSFQYQGYAIPPSQDPVPKLVWLPAFPDRIFPLPALTAAILAGAFFFVGTATLPAEAQTTPSGAHSQIFAGKQVQYQSTVAPFQAALTPVTTPTIDGWGQPPNQPLRVAQTHPAFSPFSVQPPYIPITASGGSSAALVVYPSDLRQYQSQVAPFQAALTVQVSLSWLPDYPDQIRRPALPIVGGTAEFAPSVRPLGHTGWLPRYPDYLFRPDPRASEVAGSVEVLPRIDLNWLPSYPSQIDRKVVRAADQPFWVGPLFIPVNDLRWKPIYPDWFPPKPKPVTGSTEPPYSVRSLGHVGWLPTYPDRISPPQSLATALQQATAFTFGPVNPLGHVGWLGEYPDHIDRPVVRPDWPFLALDPFPRPAVQNTLEWLPDYPNWLPVQWRPQGGSVEPPFSVRPLGHVGWLPTYPDKIWPQPGLQASAQQAFAFTFGPTNPLGHVGWLPSYPSTIDRLSVRAADQGFLFAPRYLPISDLRWLSIYPDRIDRQQVRAADQGFFYQPRFLPISDLRWAAIYPDKIWPLVTLHAALQSQPSMVFGPVIPITDLRWQAQYPDFARSIIPAPWLGSVVLWPLPIPNEPSPILAWAPSYPNLIARAILPIALYPFNGPENLVPIPNPPVDGDEKHHLGTIDSLTVTSKPTIGGATGWGTS